jgi:hypothetical protein
MKRFTLLMLDESDVVDSKKNAKASEITQEDLLFPAFYEYVGAEVVVLSLNGTENVMKTKRTDRQYFAYTPKK